MNGYSSHTLWRRRLPWLLVVATVLCQSERAAADRAAYKAKVESTAEGGNVHVRHRHDWSRVAIEVMEADVFSPDNDYSYVEFYEASTKRLIIRQPSPPITYLWVAPDGSYVVGLSEIKRGNSYQFVVFRGSGLLVHKEHIASQEACFTKAELARFLKLFPKAREPFAEWSRTIGDKTYVDVFRHGARERIGNEANYAAEHYRCAGRYPVGIRESVVNRRKWYHRKKPAIELVRNGGMLTAVSLRGIDGTRFSIPVEDDAPAPPPVASSHVASEASRDGPSAKQSAAPEPSSTDTLAPIHWWLPLGLLAAAAFGVALAWRRRKVKAATRATPNRREDGR